MNMNTGTQMVQASTASSGPGNVNSISNLKAVSHGAQFIQSNITSSTFVFHVNNVESRQETICDWISSIPYWKHHELMKVGLLDDSGQWLFKRKEFIEWQASESTVLWLHGIPGSGKSRLVACAIEHLQNQPNLAYFYCLRGESEKERSDPDEVLRSLLRQLAFAHDSDELRDEISKRYLELEKNAKKQRHDVERFTSKEVVQFLGDVLIGSTTTIIIDAFDELDIYRRGDLFDAFDEIQKRLRDDERGGTVHLLISSRDDQDIALKLSEYHNVHIGVKDNQADIRRFVEQEVKRALRVNLLLQSFVSEELRIHIENTLIKKAQGMFRWVSLQVYLLSVAKTKEALEDGLKDLPKDLRDSYKRTHDQMLSLNRKEISLAHKTIQWLLCAKASLKMDEIIDAVCIGMRIQFPDFRHRPSKEEILSVCQNLVVVDEELAIFRLAHLSVREFFETVEGFRPNELNTNALDTCISRLLDHDTIILDSHLSHAPGFEKYAIRYWIRHCEELACAGPEEPTRSKVKNFIHHDLSPTTHFETWRAKFQAQTTKTDEEEREINDGKTQDAFLAFFACIRGFLWLIDDQVSNLHWNAVNSSGDTLLIVTSIYGHAEFLEFLLELGAEVNITGFESRTALHMAARHGHLKCVVKLLEYGADVNALQSGAKVGGQTPLHEAVRHHHKEVVQHLLDRGADVEAREGKSDKTPLFLAFSTIEITRLLLHHGAKINARDAEEETPLHVALWNATSPNAGSSGQTRSTAVSVSAILIENGADIFAVRRDGITPFHWAAKEPTILDFVLSKVQSLENVRHLIETSLSQAVMANSPACLEVLLRRGLNVSVKDVSGKTALDFALELGSPEILSKLLQYHPVPGLRWNLDSEFIQNWKDQTWFKALEVQIKSASIPRMFVHQFFSYKEAKREELLRYDRNTPNLPYLQLTVPAEFDSVQGVVFRIVSHDQGWSDTADRWGGSYINSFTFFEVGVVKAEHSHSQNVADPLTTRRICQNVHASKKWHINRQIWDTRNASCSRWLLGLKPGDVIQVFPRALYPGWVNYVRSVRLELYGNEALD